MLRFLWTKIIEPWLAEIADERKPVRARVDWDNF